MASENNQVMVCIHCMAYNHEKYLADALEGFVMQKTDFPFVAVVIDDCSTDGTADVLRQYEEKYPEIIKAVYLKENYYSQHKSKQPFLEPWDSKAKYIALCEGDDYWTDPLKLQKQVDFLESHPDFGACCHRFVKYFQDSDTFTKSDHWEGSINRKGLELNIYNYFQFGKLPQILSTIYRKDLLEKTFYFSVNSRSRYDQVFFYSIVQYSKLWIINENMGVYRIHNGGIASSIAGTLVASRKYYITWKDVYSVYPTDDSFSLYKGGLCSYIYRYVKRSDTISISDLKSYIKEYNLLCETSFEIINLYIRLFRGLILRYLKK